MKICIGENIRELRSAAGMTQETLAEMTGVSVQAVSKWENGLSCPDIALLPELAEIFGISVDRLLTGKEPAPGSGNMLPELPDDGVLRVIQAMGSRLLSAEECTEEITLVIPEEADRVINAEVRGSCTVNGDIKGDLSAKSGVSCRNVGGNVNAGCGVACGHVGGQVNAGDGVACGHVGGPVCAGDSVSCKDVNGSVTAGDGVECGGVSGSVTAGDSVKCGDIGGNVSCEGNIECTVIKGSVECRGEIKYS